MTGGRSGAAVLLLVAATACVGGEDNVVTIFGPEIGPEQEHFEEVLATFADDAGIRIEVEGTRKFENEIGSRLAAADPPDIAMFPQPGRLDELSEQVAPLPPEVAELVHANFDESIKEQVILDRVVAAVPVKIDLKSLVWYSPDVFRENGYTVPTTFEEFLALADQMQANGDPPFCVGLESGDSSGWPATDWVEDFLLRVEGPETYDAWVAHDDIAFDDPAVVAVAEMVFDRWSRDGFILGGMDAALATSYADAGWPVVDGDCMMHRQGNFYSLFWPEDTDLGPGGIDAFKLPGSATSGDVTLTGGLFAVPLTDDDEAGEVLEFLAGEDFATAMAGHELGGFLSPNNKVTQDDYRNPLSQTFAEILSEAPGSVRFDGSDLMPGVVGTGTFWTAMVDIATGSEDVATAFGEVEANWPP